MNLCTSTITHFNWNKIKTFKFDFCTSQHNINVFCSASKCLNASVRECVCVRVQLSMANRIMHSHMNMASTDSFVGSTEIYWIRFCFVIAAVHLKTIRYFASMSDVDGRCVCLCYLVTGATRLPCMSIALVEPPKIEPFRFNQWLVWF